MLNGQGRKVVKERVGDQMNSYDLYRNLRDDQALDFDHSWNEMSKRMGFGGPANNRLGFAHSDGPSNFGRPVGSASIHYDDGRRGAYMDDRLRNERMPVHFNR